VELLGYWADPSVWLWAALGIGILMLANGFGPLHRTTTAMVLELGREEPDGERLQGLFETAMRWGLLQSVFMVAIIGTMVGLRGFL
jgi:hypothetical protein